MTMSNGLWDTIVIPFEKLTSLKYGAVTQDLEPLLVENIL